MFAWDRDENNSDQSQVIPHAGPNRLTSDRDEFRLGMNVKTNTFQTDLGCNIDIGTEHMHANKSNLKMKIAWQGE
jgi:hypothetical protein